MLCVRGDHDILLHERTLAHPDCCAWFCFRQHRHRLAICKYSYPARHAHQLHVSRLTQGNQCTTGTGVVVGQVAAGLVFKPIGHAKYQLIACCVGMTVFLGGLAAADQYHKTLAIAFTILGGLSVGFLELITIIMAGLVCEPGDIGLASGFLASLRQVFGTIAATIYVTILENRLKVTLPADVVPAAVKAGLKASEIPALFDAITAGTAAALNAVPGITPAIEKAVGGALQDAYYAAFKTVYLVSITFGGLAILAALFSKNIDELMTGQVARKMRGIGAKTTADDEKMVERASAS